VIYTGDCLTVMATLDAESIDAIVTDPPYGIRFMGKAWDVFDIAQDAERKRARTVVPHDKGRTKSAFTNEAGSAGAYRFDLKGNRAFQSWCSEWAAAALRVAKPGAYLLAFGGTRTVHRMTCAIEDAGWIIRDMLVWAYASGFPKGRANLKPAWEPIVMARKPGPLRPLAIDACRIGTDGVGYVQPRPTSDAGGASWGKGEHVPFHYSRAGEASASTRYTERGGTDIAALPGPRGGDAAGRWPANVILTDPIFDGGWDGVVGGGRAESVNANAYPSGGVNKDSPFGPGNWKSTYGDSGTYSRFFLIPKAARSDREPVLGGLPLRAFGQSGGAQAAIARGEDYQGKGASTGLNVVKRRANTHPTVKPTALMQHLVRLVTPGGGTVLDPFLGSGTTALACEMEGFAWIGIEKEEESVEIAEARLPGTQKGMAL